MKLSSVFATTLSSCSLLTCTALSLCCQAQAATVSGRSSGVWINPTVDSNDVQLVNTGVGTNSFTWGEAEPGTPPNQLIFTGNPFATDMNSWFKVGTLTYFNGTVYADTGVDNVTLNLGVNFDDQVPLSKVFPISFRLVNTLNDPNIDLQDPANADYVEWTAFLADPSFTVAGNAYTFELGGFGQNNQTRLTALEGQEISSDVYARINTAQAPSVPPSKLPPPQVPPAKLPPAQDVPEPSTIIGSLLLGSYLIYRKKLYKIKLHRQQDS
jgi:hypothetical protein